MANQHLHTCYACRKTYWCARQHDFWILRAGFRCCPDCGLQNALTVRRLKCLPEDMEWPPE